MECCIFSFKPMCHLYLDFLGSSLDSVKLLLLLVFTFNKALSYGCHFQLRQLILTIRMLKLSPRTFVHNCNLCFYQYVLIYVFCVSYLGLPMALKPSRTLWGTCTWKLLEQLLIKEGRGYRDKKSSKKVLQSQTESILNPKGYTYNPL